MNDHLDCSLNLTIHGPSMDGQISYHLLTKSWMPQLLWPSMDHLWMNTLPNPICQSICGCHSYCGHPWTIHGWTPCLTPSVKVSVDAIVTVVLHGPSTDDHSYWPIRGPSMDEHLAYSHLSSIRGCHSYCAIVTSDEVRQYTGGGNRVTGRVLSVH